MRRRRPIQIASKFDEDERDDNIEPERRTAHKKKIASVEKSTANVPVPLPGMPPYKDELVVVSHLRPRIESIATDMV